MAARVHRPLLASGCVGFVMMAMIADSAQVNGYGAFRSFLPLILCSTSDAPQSDASVTTLQSEPTTGLPNKRITTQLVRYPPGAATPRHVHGGDLTVYVLKSAVRSEHAGLPLAEYHAGQMFYEPRGHCACVHREPKRHGMGRASCGDGARRGCGAAHVSQLARV